MNDFPMPSSHLNPYEIWDRRPQHDFRYCIFCRIPRFIEETFDEHTEKFPSCRLKLLHHT